MNTALRFTLLVGFFCFPFFSANAQASDDAAFVLHSLSVVIEAPTLSAGPNIPDITFPKSEMPPPGARLEASVSINGANSLQAALREGAAFTLDTTILIEKPRALLPNQSVHLHQGSHIIRFDPLTREYLLLRPDALPRRHKRLDALFDAELGDIIYPFSLTSLSPEKQTKDDEYRVTLTLSLRYADVPPWLRKTLFFWSWNIIEPTAFELTFTPTPHPQTPESQYD